MTSPLTRAMRSAGINEIDVAARLGVDPKTVRRWMTGRKPYPRHRDALSSLTGWSSYDLWPDLPQAAVHDSHADEVVTVYPHRSAVPVDTWTRLFGSAREEISVLAYSALFLADDVAASAQLRYKAEAGVRVRIALGKPGGTHVLDRGAEERIGDGMGARIRTALVGFRPVVDAGAELRLHDTVLYNSIYRADNDLLINAHVFGRPASHAPVLHLRRHVPEGMAATYLDSFERVWASCSDASVEA
ncbi:XRE family transcriptional regulator [Paractinoplanes bogorensis]|nr:XRE family transcriptional regulator [Actinoplanes bogorensis]